MKITQLASSSCWASRVYPGSKKEALRIEIRSAEDVSKLTLNDNFFVAGDDIADDIAVALRDHCESIGASLVANNTKNENITRFWLAPPMKS